MNTRLRKLPACTSLRVIPSVPASFSMRVALVEQPAKNKARNRGASRCMATIATRITTIVNGRGHSAAFLATPAPLVLTGVAAHGAGLLDTAKPRTAADPASDARTDESIRPGR